MRSSAATGSIGAAVRDRYSAARLPSTADGTVRLRRPAQRRQVVALQRPRRRRRARRRLPVRHRRPQRRRRHASPTSGSTRLAAMSSSAETRARHRRVRRHRRPGRGGAARARASATASSATSARSTPSCSCCGPSPTTTSSARTDPLEHLAVARDRARPRRPRRASRTSSSASARRPSSTSRWPAEVDALDAAPGDPGRGHAALPSASTAEHRDALRPWFLLTNKPVLVVVNIGEDQLDRRPTTSPRRSRRELGAGRPRCSRCACSSRPRRPSSPPTSGPSCSTAYGLGEGALPRLRARRLPPARPAHVPHHRRQGVAGVDVQGRARRHPSAPA